MVVKHELRARRELCNARDETAAFRAFSGDQELPAYRALGSEGWCRPCHRPRPGNVTSHSTAPPLPAKIDETLRPLVISVEGGEVSGR